MLCFVFNLVSSHVAALCQAAASVPDSRRTNKVSAWAALDPQNIIALSYVRYKVSCHCKSVMRRNVIKWVGSSLGNSPHCNFLWLAQNWIHNGPLTRFCHAVLIC